MSDLAGVLDDEGRRQAETRRRLRREVLGERDPRTITSMSDLAGVLDDEGRHGEAETLYRETLQLRREVLGERDPRTITSMSNLAGAGRRRHGEAETPADAAAAP